MKQQHTQVTAEARGLKNVFRVEVVGRLGEFHGVRSSWAMAKYAAVRYARLLDAPRSVLDDGLPAD